MRKVLVLSLVSKREFLELGIGLFRLFPFHRFFLFPQGTHWDSITNSHVLTGIITSLLCGTTSLKVNCACEKAEMA